LTRREEAEQQRDYFEAQLLFAESVARRTPCALPDACLTVTNLHRRFGFGRIEGGVPSPGWARYAAGLARCDSSPSRLAWTLSFFAESTPRESAARKFGCFSCEVLDADNVVRIHFGNRDSTGDCGPLARAKVDRRLSELREMFGFLRANHPKARTVRGASWLYNREAYRRLFPPDYAASVFEPERVRLDGTSSWGQLLDFRSVARPAVRQAILANIETVDIATPWKAFPLRALGAQSAIENFYEFYGC
jgi:hypothetical protein